jgi:hypothetical protein
MGVVDGEITYFRKTISRERKKERDGFWICFEVSKKRGYLSFVR